MERIPYRATDVAAAYDAIRTLPVAVLLDYVRSAYNVGAFFRSADAVGASKVHLCGFTARPPHSKIAKTALGAEASVAWEGHDDAVAVVRGLQASGCSVAAIETSVRAIDLFDWQTVFPVCVVFGHEVDGVRPEVLDLCDAHVRIPMLGSKHSLNVATAGGAVLFELLRKYRTLMERQG
jgi:23S rRNA (guanosine2251-2'-O)-methyltransferase